MGIPTNPSFALAHLGHVEVLTNKFDESLDFFTRVYGLKLETFCISTMIFCSRRRPSRGPATGRRPETNPPPGPTAR